MVESWKLVKFDNLINFYKFCIMSVFDEKPKTIFG